MTILVGVLCKDGVIIGADGSATFGAGQMRTIEQPMQKIDILDGAVIVAGTGEIGLGQRFSAITKQAFSETPFRQKKPLDLVTELSQRTLNNFGATIFKNLNHCIPYGALVAFQNGGATHLCEFQLENMRPELKTDKLWYVSMGSGQVIVDPFLSLMRKAFWNAGPPTKQDATFAVTWALLHAVDCNPGGIGEPIQIAELTKDGKGHPHARLLGENELQEHRQNVQNAVEYLGAYRDKLKGTGAAPEVPKPAASVTVTPTAQPASVLAGSITP